MPTQYENIKKNDWKIGFEVECYGYGSESDFKERLRSILAEIEIDRDDSVCYDKNYADQVWTMEFKTPPLPIELGLQILTKCFNSMREFGVKTDDTCGFHVNFSPISDKVYKKLNPMKIYIDPLWTKIAKAFGRQNNQYASAPRATEREYKFAKKFQNGYVISPLELFTWMEEMSFHGDLSDVIPDVPEAPDPKSTAINLSYLQFKRTKCSRIEVRAMGNTNYHLRLPEIEAFIDQSLGVFKKTMCA